MSIDEEIRRVVSDEVARQLPDAVRELLSSMMMHDRREAPRLAAEPEPSTKKAATKKAATKKRAKLTCPVEGCRSAFSPRFGGWCVDHRNTAGFRAWTKKR
jgi:hypothetical protein